MLRFPHNHSTAVLEDILSVDVEASVLVTKILELTSNAKAWAALRRHLPIFVLLTKLNYHVQWRKTTPSSRWSRKELRFRILVEEKYRK